MGLLQIAFVLYGTFTVIALTENLVFKTPDFSGVFLFTEHLKWDACSSFY